MEVSDASRSTICNATALPFEADQDEESPVLPFTTSIEAVHSIDAQ